MKRGRTSTLSFEWRAWAARNLARGVSRERVTAELRARRVPQRAIAAALDEIAASPGFVAACELAVTARRAELLCGLQLALQRTRTRPDRIERRSGVSAAELFERYYATNTPVVLTDVVRKWPAFEKWTPEHLAERVGDAWIRVTTDRVADPDYDMHTAQHSKRMRLRDLVRMIRERPRSNDFYAVAQNRNIDRPALAPLWRDVRLDRRMVDRRLLRGGAALWLGPAGTITPLHHDTSNILFGQVYGRKRFWLASPHEMELWDGARSFYAKGPPAEHARVSFARVTLAPGDALFLPVGWWHHVEALDVSISLAFTCFARANFFDWYRPGDLATTAAGTLRPSRARGRSR